MKPVVIVNFKKYKKGDEVVKLAKVIEGVDKEIIIGVLGEDVKDVVDAVGLRVCSQEFDGLVGKKGGFGCFLNHSDYPLGWDVLKENVVRCRGLGLKTVVFASGLKIAQKIEKLGVDYLVIEPPELIGGEVSVSKARPELIEEVAKGLKGKFLVGAGINSGEDVKIAMKLGACGIAVSSAVVKAKMPGNVLKGLVGCN